MKAQSTTDEASTSPSEARPKLKATKPKAAKPKPSKSKSQQTDADEAEANTTKPKPTSRKRKAPSAAGELPVKKRKTKSDAKPPGDGIPDPVEDGRRRRAPQISTKGAPPITSLFREWPEKQRPKDIITIPEVADPLWGIIPVHGKDGPQPHPDQPSARSSNAATVPPLWEDRGFRFKHGRWQDRVGSSADTPDDEGGQVEEKIDQEKHLVIKLMDMRPIMNKDGTSSPRRKPIIYYYENGIPDWDSTQALKALNDRRRDAIARHTCDFPWSELERQYLTQLCTDHPDASILELAERFNYRFQGDFKEVVAFGGFHKIHPGRTIESIRYEYCNHKKLYDQGEVPKPTREETEKQDPKGKNKGQHPDDWMREHFGPFITDPGNEYTGPIARKRRAPLKLELPVELEDELLELAGFYLDKVRSLLLASFVTTNKISQDTGASPTDSPVNIDADSSSDLSDVPNDLDSAV